MTQICVALTEPTTAGMIDRMADLAVVADLFEIRGDMLMDLDLLTILRAKTRPLVFTCRSRAEGGRWGGTEDRRRLALLEAAKRGYDYVDVEHRTPFVDVIAEKAGRGLILSHHDLEGVPANLVALYREMAERGADIVKIAVTPRSVADVGRLLDFAAGVARTGGTPLVAIAMGPLGTITRVIGGRYGAPFTFASAVDGAESAPGQVPAAQMAGLYRVRRVTAETRVYGVVGTHVTRSLSPVLHNSAFEARGVDAVYVPLQAEALPPFLAALPAFDLAGFSVTRPYKVEILPHLREVDEAGALCGSVNTIVVDGGGLRGSTTDGLGVLTPLRRRLDVRGKQAVILGAGGAARAAALALARKGTRVKVLARDPQKAEAVAALVGCGHGALDELGAATWDVLLNATPVGSSAADRDATPVPASLHRPGSIVFDMVYDPLETRLLREARSAGCAVIDGLEMLLAQAEAQFETWTGLAAPAEVMREAALVLMQEREA